MRVLIGCEMSGIVRDAFAEKGHDAFSNDKVATIAIPRGNHLKMCVLDAIRDHGSWDFIGLHPECRYLAVSGIAGTGVACHTTKKDFKQSSGP